MELIIIILGIFFLGIVLSGLKSFCGFTDETKKPHQTVAESTCNMSSRSSNSSKQMEELDSLQATPLNFVVGALSVATDKRGTFINYAKQFLKQAPISYAKLQPYLPQLIDKIFEYSHKCGYEIADEVDLVEATLNNLVGHITKDEVGNLPTSGPLPVLDGFKVYAEFINEYPIK